MAEPQPSTIHEGASTPPAPQKPPAAASEAAALSSLDNKTISSDAANNGPKKEVDLKALNDAMKALDAGSGKKATATAGAAGAKKDEEPAKLIKVDAADVALVAEQLDLSKPKATELLRAHDADAVRAMKAWVTAAV